MSTAALGTTALRSSDLSGTALGTYGLGRSAGDSFCPGCATELPFETPLCDEHGADCPELACVICGWALIGPFEVAALGTRSRAAAR